MTQDDETGAPPRDHDPALPVRRLSLASFLPVAALTGWLAISGEAHPWHMPAATLLVAYASLMLTFIAGTRLGFAVATQPQADRRDAVIALAIVLAAWATLLLPVPHGFVVLAIAFAAQGAWDAFAVQAGIMPDWYGRVRTRMTFLMVAAMIAALVVTG